MITVIYFEYTGDLAKVLRWSFYLFLRIAEIGKGFAVEFLFIFMNL